MLVFGSSCVMAAVGWMVQLLNYPTFVRIPEAGWAEHHDHHCRNIGYVVMLPMLVQTGGAAWLAVRDPNSLLISGAALALFGFFWTFAVSAPCHGRLSRRWCDQEIKRLVRGNLPRTLAWSAHVVVAATVLCLPA